jgi:DNA-directed RNA polymerase specialized sigma24 family protein
MLELLCKKDDFWRRVAFNICKDKTLADDLVQDMYIKLSDCTKEINDFYVIITIKNIFLNHLKKESLTINIDDYDFKDMLTTFELNDKEINFIGRLKWYERDVIEMTYDKSFHEIQRDLNVNYQFVRRILIKAQTKWQEENQKA